MTSALISKPEGRSRTVIFCLTDVPSFGPDEYIQSLRGDPVVVPGDGSLLASVARFDDTTVGVDLKGGDLGKKYHVSVSVVDSHGRNHTRGALVEVTL